MLKKKNLLKKIKKKIKDKNSVLQNINFKNKKIKQNKNYKIKVISC